MYRAKEHNFLCFQRFVLCAVISEHSFFYYLHNYSLLKHTSNDETGKKITKKYERIFTLIKKLLHILDKHVSDVFRFNPGNQFLYSVLPLLHDF